MEVACRLNRRDRGVVHRRRLGLAVPELARDVDELREERKRVLHLRTMQQRVHVMLQESLGAGETVMGSIRNAEVAIERSSANEPLDRAHVLADELRGARRGDVQARDEL